MLKMITALFLSFIIVSSNFGQRSKKSISKPHLPWIQFNWQGDSLAHRYFDKMAIAVPVAIDGLPYHFNMQLDLGAVTTVIYGNSIRPYLAKNPDRLNNIDTVHTFRIQGQINPKFKDVELKLGDVSFGKRDIGYFRNYGDSIPVDSINTISEKQIGTIAPDLFQNRILIIDYPHNKLCVIDELPKQFDKAVFQTMKVLRGRIKIPFMIGDSTYDVMFDTGSSIFDLTTDKEKFRHCVLPDTPVIDSLQISSWGNSIMAYGMPINRPFKFGRRSFKNAKLYYFKSDEEVNFYNEEKIIGITGNSLFLKNIVIIDYKSSRFGVL